MYEYLDRRYAQAIYDIGEKKGKVEEFMQELRSVCVVFEENKELRSLVDHPEISLAKKKDVFTKMFKGKIDDELLTFLYILLEKGRVLYLREKLEELEEIYLEKLNTIKAVVKTSIPLTTEQYDNLVKKIERLYGKNVILEQKISDEIIGGVYLRVKNQIIDGTIDTKYKNMKRAIVNKK